MDRVRIAIIDANNAEQLAFMDNGARDSLHYYDDILHTYLQGSAYTFECKVEKDHPDAQYIQAGNKLSFVWKQMPYNLTIMQTHEDESCIELTAYACCFELLNETAIAYTASSAMTLAQYLAVFLPDNDFVTVGINEASSYTRKLEWTGDNDSILKRLYSLASSFDAELEVIPTLNPDYTLGTIVLNFYLEHSDTQQGIGENRSDVVLRYGVDVEGISRDVDVTELYTAILPTGKDGLTLRTYAAQTVLDEDGNVLFTKPANDPVIYAPQARERYPSNVVAESDRYILYRWGTDYSTQASLYGNALTKLKSICEPKATYEVKGYTELNIGDTVMIVDDGFDPVLYLSARVVEQQISFTDKSRNETTFDNVTEMVSQIDDSLLARVQELASQVAQSVAGATVQYYVSTSPTELIGGSWSATSPTWTDGSYIWTRTQFTANDGTVTYSNPACSTGAAGANGSALYAVCDSSATTMTKVINLADVTDYYVGLTINVTFTNGNRNATPELQVNSLDPVRIFCAGVLITTATKMSLLFSPGTTLSFVYGTVNNQNCFRLITDIAGSYSGECSSASAADEKLVDIPSAVVMNGTRVTVKFLNANSSAYCYLKVGSAEGRIFSGNGIQRFLDIRAGMTMTVVWGYVMYDASSWLWGWKLAAEDGQDALAVSLSNDNHTFAGGTSSALADSVTCEVQAFKGATRVAATIGTITGQPTGMTTTIVDNGTTSASIVVAVTTSMTTASGVLTIPITVEGETFTKEFSYSLALQGAQGAQGPAGANGKMLFGTCSTATGTAAKVVVCSEATELYAGLAVFVSFSVANSSATALTLNVNNLGAKDVYCEGAVTSSTNPLLWAANASILFIYDGTGWIATGYGKSYFGTSATAATSRAKSSSIAGFVGTRGTRVSIRFTNANTYTAAAPRLNVSATGAIDIYLNSSAVAGDSPYLWGSGEIQTFIFVGNRWEIDNTAVIAKALA